MSWKININGTFFITIIFISVALMLSFVLFNDVEDYSDLFKATEGTLQLSPEDLEHNIPLKGQWLFYNDVLLEPGVEIVNKSDVVEVPHVWGNNQSVGYGTYKLQIKGLKPNECYSLYIYDMVTAYKLYIGDTLIAQNGVVGTSKDAEKISWKPIVAGFKPQSSEIGITIQISNFNYSPGGLWKSISIGKSANITIEREINIVTQMILFGGILMIAIYNLSLFLLIKGERAALYFSIFNFIVAFRIPLMGERLINNWMNNPDWIMLTKIQYLLGYSMLAFFMLFLFKLFEDDFHRIVIYINIAVVTLLNLTVFVFPIDKFKLFDNLYMGIAASFLLYILFVLIVAIRKKRRGSVYSFIGLAFVVCATFGDMVVPPGSNLISIGIFMFMLFHSLVIAEKYSFITDENVLLHHTATRDGMTSLFKKEHFSKLVTQFLEESNEGMHHSIIFIDIDDFKVINDTYGHDAGDEFIISISERIIRSLRNTDIACRYGGDEFLVWVDNTTPDEVLIVAQRLLDGISEPIMLQDNEVSVSVSMGISLYPRDGHDVETLITKSDERMYHAKSLGKNQYVMGEFEK